MYKNGVALPLSTQSTEQFHSTKEAAQQKGGGSIWKKPHRSGKWFDKYFCNFFLELWRRCLRCRSAHLVDFQLPHSYWQGY